MFSVPPLASYLTMSGNLAYSEYVLFFGITSSDTQSKTPTEKSRSRIYRLTNENIRVADTLILQIEMPPARTSMPRICHATRRSLEVRCRYLQSASIWVDCFRSDLECCVPDSLIHKRDASHGLGCGFRFSPPHPPQHISLPWPVVVGTWWFCSS